MLASRQAGKSQTAAALALRESLLYPNSLVLIFSPTLRQSGELLKAKILPLYDQLGRPVGSLRDSALALELTNGSRILSLPGNEANVRGYSAARMVIIDEASRVPDPLYFAIRPMLAVSGGSLVVLSTPWGKTGWFYDTWQSQNKWERVRVTAHQCPRISAEFLEEERRTLGERWFACEYMAEFVEAIDSVFAEADIMAAVDGELQPLF